MDYLLQDRLDLPQLHNFEPVANLRDQEGIFRSIFENISDPILIWKEGRIADCNAAALRLLGYGTKAELMQRSPLDISPELQPDGRSSQEKMGEMLDTALRVGQHRFEWLQVRADGSGFSVEVILTPVTIGAELILYSLWRDISEPKLVEHAQLSSEAKYRALYDSTSDAVTLLDERGFFDCNDAALRIFGCPSQEEFLKAHPADLSPPL